MSRQDRTISNTYRVFRGADRSYERGTGKRVVLSAGVPEPLAEWVAAQTRVERRNVSWILRRALVLEKQRVEALGKNPSPDDLDFGRV
jgi:hypothetical protein